MVVWRPTEASRHDGSDARPRRVQQLVGRRSRMRAGSGSDSGSGRRSPYQMSRPSRRRIDLPPVKASRAMVPRTSRPEYARSFRPDVVTDSRRTTNFPWRRSARLMAASSAPNMPSLNPPVARNASRVQNRKQPLARPAAR